MNVRKDGACKYDTNKAVRQRIDKLLEENASLQATLGEDSDDHHRSVVNTRCNALLLQIREIDYLKYIRLVPQVYIPEAWVKKVVEQKSLTKGDLEELEFLFTQHQNLEL